MSRIGIRRLLAKQFGISFAAVARAWRDYGMQPWREEAFKFSTGEVTGACQPRHRHQEFLALLKQVAPADPDQDLHLVMDNYATHKRREVRDWLARLDPA